MDKINLAPFKQAVVEAAKQIVANSSAEDMNKYVPKRCFNQVAKLNAALKELQQMTGDEYPEILDTSAGYESFIKIIGDVRIENGELIYTELDDGVGSWYRKAEPSEERENLVVWDDDEQSYYFSDWGWKDTMSYLNNGVRKAKKYFQEYNPDWDEDEEQRGRFLNGMDD